MSINQATAIMRNLLLNRTEAERDYLVAHFIDELREKGITPSPTFLEAFEVATAPFKK